MNTLAPLALEQVSFIGNELNRPECAVAHSTGVVFAPDWTGDGGVSAIDQHGTTYRHAAHNWQELAEEHGFDEPLRGNGICLLEGGEFLIAHLGENKGGIFHLSAKGEVTPHLLDIDGETLPPSNFVLRDHLGRTWITVSTRRLPRAKAYRHDVADGFIAVVTDGKARIVADGLGYTNECLLHPDGKRLFVNETFSRSLTVFDVADDGSLSNRRTFAKFGPGVFPDGLAFDVNGHAWVTSIVSNRVLRVDSDGNVSVYLEDADQAHLDWVERAWRDHAMGRPHLDKAAGRVLRNVSNLAFCGEALDCAVLGCLLGDRLATIPMPVRGHQPQHWTCNIDPLIRTLQTSTNTIG